MKLVIEIPEEYYNNIEPFLNGETIKGGFNLFKALEIIKNGKPLPKGHGRLIDADAVLKEIIYAQKSLESNNDSMWEINKPYFKGLAWAHRIVLDVPTVIEADKEGGAE